MLELVKVENIKPNLQIGEYEECYKLEKDKLGIGYGTLNKDMENQVFIYVDKQQRGKGYGKALFSKMLEESKNKGYKEVTITFEKENIPMLKIATDHEGIQTSSEGKNFKYVISLK